MFIALPPLQLLRKSPRRSSSALVSGSCWVKVFMGNHRLAAFVSESILRGIHTPEPKHAHLVCRLSHFSTCSGRHSSSASNRSAGDSRASTSARLFLRLRRRRQQSVEPQIDRDGAVVIGPIAGQGDERKSAQAFAATEQLDLVCEL